MKKYFVLSLLLILNLSLFAQQKKADYSILVTGASFSTDENGWFEMGCEKLNANAWNKSIGGEAICHTANKMAEGTLYTEQEFDEIDAFVIMHVHDKDVSDPNQLKINYEEYKLPFTRADYAAAYDYVIKKYIADCFKQKDNPKSKYYNTLYGKPPVIVLCTSWHDGRTVYNKTIRELATKWGLPLVKFDEYIGFSQNIKHPITGESMSMMYAIGMTNKQVINGENHGWHPEKGHDKYIQKRMASIFIDEMRRILPIK